MYRLRNYVSYFLLFLSLVFVLPKEFYHSFTHHEDTPVDVCAGHADGLHIEEQHHSCELLKHKFVPEFIVLTEASEISSPIFYIRYTARLSCSVLTSSISQLLRGPPAVI